MKPMKSEQVDCLKQCGHYAHKFCVVCLSVNSNINRLAFMEMHHFLSGIFIYLSEIGASRGWLQGTDLQWRKTESWAAVVMTIVYVILYHSVSLSLQSVNMKGQLWQEFSI